MSESRVLPGAEPFSATGGASGALVVHGFTGCPQSMRPLAEALAAAGLTVELPRLPGHGTSVEDLATTGWPEWTATVEETYRDLASRCDRVVVTGLSMGGALALWLAARHPEIAGIAVINSAVGPGDPSAAPALRARLEGGVELIPGVGGDIRKEGVRELAYDQVPVRSLLSLIEGLAELDLGLGDIACPTLVLTSPEDHVVAPEQSDRIARSVAGSVERIVLANSYHVATLDHDAARIEEGVVAFARRVCAAVAD